MTPRFRGVIQLLARSTLTRVFFSESFFDQECTWIRPQWWLLDLENEGGDPGEEKHADVAVQEGWDDGVTDVVMPAIGIQTRGHAE